MKIFVWTKKEEVPVVTAPIKPVSPVQVFHKHEKTDTIRLDAKAVDSYHFDTLGGYNSSYRPVRLADLEEFCRKVRQSGAGDGQGVYLNKGNVHTTVDLLKVRIDDQC